MNRNILIVLCTSLLALSGWQRPGTLSVQAANVATPGAAAPEQAFLPAGTAIRVRMEETLDTHRNRGGDRFTATLSAPIAADNNVAIPAGTTFAGHVVDSRPSGRFKGRAVLALTLDSFELQGQVYHVRATNSVRTSKGHKRHNWAWIGGGTASGAGIGALAGGGIGAAIGAGAGAVAGTAGAVITGKRNVRIPVETTLSFTLKAPVTLGS